MVEGLLLELFQVDEGFAPVEFSFLVNHYLWAESLIKRCSFLLSTMITNLSVGISCFYCPSYIFFPCKIYFNFFLLYALIFLIQFIYFSFICFFIQHCQHFIIDRQSLIAFLPFLYSNIYPTIMSVLIETSFGDITVDLWTQKCPNATLNFLKLCKMKHFNSALFAEVQKSTISS